MQAPATHIFIDTKGIPRTINSSIPVHSLVKEHYLEEKSITALSNHYHISIADVYAALAYYHDNRSFFGKALREKLSPASVG